MGIEIVLLTITCIARLSFSLTIFSLPGRSPERAIVLPPASALVKLSFYVKVFYVMGNGLSGELSCPCDRSCLNA